MSGAARRREQLKAVASGLKLAADLCSHEEQFEMAMGLAECSSKTQTNVSRLLRALNDDKNWRIREEG